MAKKSTKTVEVVESPKAEVIVTLPNGFTRTYSLEIHGENFEKLAEAFATQHEGATIA